MAMDRPLKLYWGPDRGDNFSTATEQGAQDALAVGYSFIRVEGYIAPAPQGAPVVGPQPGYTATIEKTVAGEVGNHKFIRTSATLYRNGVLQVVAYSRCRHWSEGLSGRVLVVCVDSLGNATWVSEVFRCKTRGSRGDVFTASAGTDLFTVQFPEAVGKYTQRLDVYQGEVGSRDWQATKQAFVDGLKDAKEIAQEVKDVLYLLG